MSEVNQGDDRLAAGEQIRRGWAFFQSQRPIAAWAAWQSVVRQDPENKAAAEALGHLADALDLPEVGRKPLRFQPPEGEERRLRWNEVFRTSAHDFGPAMPADPTAAAVLFRGLWDDDRTDAAAAWNLAVCLAWAGSNRSAVDALETFVELKAESKPDEAADAWTLAELLRHGAGAEELADGVTLSVTFEEADLGVAAEDFLASYGQLARYRSLGSETADSGVIAADILERPLVEGPKAEPIIASAVAAGGRVRLSAPASVEAGLFFRDLTQLVGWFIEQNLSVDRTVLPLAMQDAALARFRLPETLPASRRDALARQAVVESIETDWISQPRHGLGGLTPLAASRKNDSVTRVKLEGIVQFMEQLARRPGSRPIYQDYEFDRLRYRLGLIQPPGKDDAKGEARHKTLLWFNLDHVRSVPVGAIPEANVRTAWETATACHEDALAVGLGERLKALFSKEFVEISAARWAAPFLRKAVQEESLEAALGVLDKAITLDREYAYGWDNAKLLLWRAQAVTRLGSPEDAVAAWDEACLAANAAPIRQFDAVIELCEDDESADMIVKIAKAWPAHGGTRFVEALLRRYVETAAGEA